MAPYFMYGIRTAKDHALASLALDEKSQRRVHFPGKFIVSLVSILEYCVDMLNITQEMN